MKRVLLGCGLLYALLVVFCGFGAAMVPASTQRVMAPYVWLLGPPASLLHGTSFLWPFVVGTLVVAASIIGIARSESRAVRVNWAVVLVITWAACGFLAYAPSA